MASGLLKRKQKPERFSKSPIIDSGINFAVWVLTRVGGRHKSNRGASTTRPIELRLYAHMLLPEADKWATDEQNKRQIVSEYVSCFTNQGFEPENTSSSAAGRDHPSQAARPVGFISRRELKAAHRMPRGAPNFFEATPSFAAYLPKQTVLD